MSRSVLCAVDISNKGKDDAVLKEAKRLADMDGAQLDVVTVIPDYGKSVVATFFDQSHHDQAVAEAKTALKEQIIASLGADADASVRHVVATGSAYEEILHVAAETNCGLIVIGAHKPDFSDYLLGPNAARVVRHSKCSVHVVR
ncbi:universal stress protein [Cognatishimia activa]|uniref:Universal stress protein F n=1 Tax=Cognatishimia activa TaxID=1715691 RepID=A0A0P1IT28_9RHOB|nr:universal stress protein [Cognatishimia activa]CUI73495.1 Universal stress protein F [Cognatishimia activa]CUK26651.1 Universal stress protein F [Cognatishimia activa]